MRKSLRRRITLLMTFMTLILLVVNAVISTLSSKSNFESLSDNVYQETANYYAEIIDSWFKTNGAILTTTADSAKVIEGDIQSLRPMLAKIVDDNQTVSEIYYVTNDNDMVFGYYEAPDDFIAIERSWFIGAKATSGIYYTEPYVDQISGALCISMSYAIDSGVIGIDLDLDALTSNVPTPENGYTIVATDQNSIVVHPEYGLSADTVHTMDEVVDGSYIKAILSGGAFKDYTGESSYLTSATVNSNNWTVAVITPKNIYRAPINKMIRIFVILAIIFCVAAAVVVTILSNNITTPIIKMTQKINSIVEDIKAGNGDLSARVEVHSEDETGKIGNGINALMEELDQLIPQSKSAANTVSGHSDELVEITDRLSDAMSGISIAVGDIAQGATKQAQDVAEANENVKQIGMAIDNVVSATDELNDIAKEMQTSSMESENQLKHLQESTDTMVGGIERISEQIKDTSKAVDLINEKVAAISEIASQTNLLSLNASIEAARAGEMGKGFAVVAEEIGKLAVDSAETAESIKDEMDALLASSQSTVVESGEVHELTLKQQEVLKSTTDTIHSLLAQISRTTEYIGDIRGDVAQCVEARKIIEEAMDSLSSISETNAASSEETSATTSEISNTIGNLSTQAKDLSGVASELTDSLSIFK